VFFPGKVTHFIGFEGPAPGMECYTELLSRCPDDESDTEVDDEGPLFICYTSGTTGRPRGALYTQGTFREAVIGHTIDVPVGDGGKLLGLMPPFHIGGIINLAYVFYQAAPGSHLTSRNLGILKSVPAASRKQT